MTKLQLLLFSWISAWVLAESISPGITYEGKLQASLIAIFATGLAKGMYGDFLRMLTWWKR